MSYFLFVPLHSFFLCYSGEALEGQILTGFCKNSTMLILITTYKYEKITILSFFLPVLLLINWPGVGSNIVTLMWWRNHKNMLRPAEESHVEYTLHIDSILGIHHRLSRKPMKVGVLLRCGVSVLSLMTTSFFSHPRATPPGSE